MTTLREIMLSPVFKCKTDAVAGDPPFPPDGRREGEFAFPEGSRSPTFMGREARGRDPSPEGRGGRAPAGPPTIREAFDDIVLTSCAHRGAGPRPARREALRGRVGARGRQADQGGPD